MVAQFYIRITFKLTCFSLKTLGCLCVYMHCVLKLSETDKETLDFYAHSIPVTEAKLYKTNIYKFQNILKNTIKLTELPKVCHQK